jgi:hypothetical protein
MNKFVSGLVQFYKRNEKLFERQLLKWQMKYTDKEVEREAKAKEMIKNNHRVLEKVIGKHHLDLSGTLEKFASNLELMNVVDNFGAINSRVSHVEKMLFGQINPSKLKEMPRLAKEMKHSLSIIEESILANRRGGSENMKEDQYKSELTKFSEQLKANFELCNSKFLQMQTQVQEFQGLFKDCLRVADFKDKEDLIIILKKENEVKQKLLHKYKALIEKELTSSKDQEHKERDFDAEFNKRHRTSTTFIKLLQEENVYLMSKNAEISEKVLASKMEINKRLEKIQKDMKHFWRSFSNATGKDTFGSFYKKKKGIESSLAEFGRYNSDFRKMLLRHEKFVEQVSKSGEGILIEIQKEFARLKKCCKGFHFLDSLIGNDLILVISNHQRTETN